MDVQPIENHGIIGDLRTAALVAMDGSISTAGDHRLVMASESSIQLDRESIGMPPDSMAILKAR